MAPHVFGGQKAVQDFGDEIGPIALCFSPLPIRTSVRNVRVAQITGCEAFLLMPPEARGVLTFALGETIHRSAKLRARFYRAIDGEGEDDDEAGGDANG